MSQMPKEEMVKMIKYQQNSKENKSVEKLVHHILINYNFIYGF
jgi:hypothetical protein